MQVHPEPDQRWETKLPAHAGSVPAARRFVGAILRRSRREELRDTVELLTSELVSNALYHAGTDFDLVIDLQGEVVRVTVGDRNPGKEVVVEDPSPLATGGRGLLLVRALANRWGVERQPRSKQVWFEAGPDDAVAADSSDQSARRAGWRQARRTSTRPPRTRTS